MEEIDKEIKRALFICAPFVIIVFFLDDLDRLFTQIHSRLGNPLLVVVLFICTIIIVISLVDAAISAWHSYRMYGYITLVPLSIYIFALIDSQWSPFRFSSEAFAGKVTYRAYMRDQYGHTSLKMRENGKFEIRYPGPFAISDWQYGQWERRNDTFYLHFIPARDSHESTDHISDTMVLDSNYLRPVKMTRDTFDVYKNYLLKFSQKK